MAFKGLACKRRWEVWGRREAQLHSGEDWTFDIKQPGEGAILVGGELGPIDASILFGDESYIREKLKRKAEKIRGYLDTLVSVIHQAAKAYHGERFAFRVLKQTGRQRAQYFLRVFAQSSQVKLRR